MHSGLRSDAVSPDFGLMQGTRSQSVSGLRSDVEGKAQLVRTSVRCRGQGPSQFPNFDWGSSLSFVLTVSVFGFSREFLGRYNGIIVDNGYVVPYNKHLCSRFDAHINVEYCGWNMMIKCLFKYISKGVDRVRLTLQKSEGHCGGSTSVAPIAVNEIKSFWMANTYAHMKQHGGSLTFLFTNPTIFKESARLDTLIDNPDFVVTMLTKWLHNNQKDSRGVGLTYNEYLSKYKWDTRAKAWVHRAVTITSTSTTMGRLAYAHPTAGELFYLGIWLSHQKGCKSFVDIRTVRGQTYFTYRDVCDALGLTGDDKEWLTTFHEAAFSASSSELRSLFCHLLIFYEVGTSLLLWESAKDKMGDDICYSYMQTYSTYQIIPDTNIIEQQVLLDIQKTLPASTPSKSLADFGLPLPSSSVLAVLKNRLLLEETSYDKQSLASQYTYMVSQLNPHQLKVHEQKKITPFLYGHGGTGKTFMWTTLLSYLRSIGKIVLAVAASGITSLLLPSGRTTHSRFVIPIDLTDKSSCNLLKLTSMIIWDEAPMSDRQCFEFLDKSLRDILEDDSHFFGRMSMLLGGDFRQTLPYSEFASWLLDIGDGNIRTPDKEDPHSIRIIHIPDMFLIKSKDQGLATLIDFVYGSEILTNASPQELSAREIICPKNETAERFNTLILSKTQGQEVVYNNYDSIKSPTRDALDLDTLYP
uniref:ATP-dependent DNA helicase n=1 Tax=Lactuca sativa TaxID=4236 RepID=A0A9R1W5Y9_LACSA|nr:hypothetical protein LSAT_V11C200065900 [Lactuca sativa]